MKFQPGQSGNPEGRPKGGQNKRTQLAKLLEPHAEELINKLIELAKTGEANALRLCIERLIPKIKNDPIELSLQGIDVMKTANLPSVVANILLAVTRGEITPDQGKLLCDVIESQRKIIETVELDTRISAIEHNLKQRERGVKYAGK